MPEPLNFALIGAGAHIAGRHLEVLNARDDARWTGACDSDAVAAERIAERTGAPFFTHVDAMLEAARPDVTVITTPHPSHRALAERALAAGSHVLVEKPVATHVADADAMIDAAARHGRFLAVAFQHRFAPLTERARALVDDGTIGAPIRVTCTEPWLRTAAYFRAAAWRATWRGEGGGVLLNQAPHTLDLLCHLVGPPTRVWGVTRTLRHDTECEDTAHAMLEFANGATGYVAASTIEAGAGRRLELVGDHARLLLEDDTLQLTRFEPSLSKHLENDPEPFGAPTLHRDPPEALAGTGHHAQVYEDLIQAARDGRPPRVTGAEARMSLELANAITLSSHREAPVTLPLDRAAYVELLTNLQEGRAA